MIKKTITYTDYNGLERTEDFWFNITEAEALEMEMSTTGGYGDMIRRVVAAQDMPTIITSSTSPLTAASFQIEGAYGSRVRR